MFSMLILEIGVDYCRLASVNGLFRLRSTGQFCVLNITLCFYSTSNLFFFLKDKGKFDYS